MMAEGAIEDIGSYLENFEQQEDVLPRALSPPRAAANMERGYQQATAAAAAAAVARQPAAQQKQQQQSQSQTGPNGQPKKKYSTPYDPNFKRNNQNKFGKKQLPASSAADAQAGEAVQTEDGVPATTAAAAAAAAKKDKYLLNHKLLLDKQRGLPHLYSKFKEENYIKFRGKGHESADLKMLLQYYELWAHSLYPKYTFKDFAERVENIGKLREMRHYLQHLIVNGDSADNAWEDEEEEYIDLSHNHTANAVEAADSTTRAGAVAPASSSVFGGDDDYNALLQESMGNPIEDEMQRAAMEMDEMASFQDINNEDDF